MPFCMINDDQQLSEHVNWLKCQELDPLGRPLDEITEPADKRDDRGNDGFRYSDEE